MLLIQDIIVSEEVVTEQFICNLNACKGACCWEGDFGAPLENEELAILNDIYPIVKPYLTDQGRTAIEENGTATYFADVEQHGTTLIDNGACAFMTKNALGIACCGIEQAHKEGKIDFKKPISCHLYPIRVTKNEHTDFEALNYEEWDICSAACSLGKTHKMPVYKFLKEPLIRKYGESFYEELDAAAAYLTGK
jgi:hypothetical protein